jgi:hypothetical protein
MSQIQLSVINMSQYYGLEVLKYIKALYNLHIKNIYITYEVKSVAKMSQILLNSLERFYYGDNDYLSEDNLVANHYYYG